MKNKKIIYEEVGFNMNLLINLSITDLKTIIDFMKKENERYDCFKTRAEDNGAGDYSRYQDRIKYEYDPEMIIILEGELKQRIKELCI